MPSDMGKISQVRKQFVKTSNTQMVSEFGSRIVHISLVDVDNVPILAIVGTELRPRQISYAVTEEFIKHLGLDKSQYTEKRWTSKNEVYGWLKNFLLNPSSDYCMQSGEETLSNVETTRMENVEGEVAKKDGAPSSATMQDLVDAGILLPTTFPFKRMQLSERYPKGQARGRHWKHLKQMLQAENYHLYPADEPNWFEAPYTDPRTKLHFANTDVFKQIRSLPNEYVQGYLALRNAQVVLK